jgi:hypothetical protein
MFINVVWYPSTKIDDVTYQKTENFKFDINLKYDF